MANESEVIFYHSFTDTCGAAHASGLKCDRHATCASPLAILPCQAPPPADRKHICDSRKNENKKRAVRKIAFCAWSKYYLSHRNKFQIDNLFPSLYLIDHMKKVTSKFIRRSNHFAEIALPEVIVKHCFQTLSRLSVDISSCRWCPKIRPAQQSFCRHWIARGYCKASFTNTVLAMSGYLFLPHQCW